ncbi:ubiquitin-conjugating enzyme E2 G1-like [Bactrocera neohumeralis]|uniref:ubiquitin-conjugating enzyme E2 G1-like n=1 Tax=Bactrocera neohumeralis TaxID=98809 RepID=UPI00216586C7|nr:ubiquitin-conjugating enzyme E2 G1-like [Bactrocera neohumeralis]
MKFVTEIWHPNIEKNGDVCNVETIMISVISMLADPNDGSPANVDAAKEWRESYPDFKRKVARCVRKSQEECS